jgi:uncharacterized membrane protein YphA (DoxX/SURF4 family)
VRRISEAIALMLEQLHRLVRAHGSGRAAGLLRIIIGAACLIRAVEGWSILNAVVRWPLRFPYDVGMAPMTVDAVAPFCITWTVTAALFSIGLLTRAAGVVLATVLLYALFIDQQTYSNHQLLLGIVVLLLVWADSGSELSVDSRLRGSRPIPMWPVFLLKVQLSIVYFFSAIAKVNATCLSGVVIYGSLRDSGPFALPAALRQPPVLATMAVMTIVVELFLSVAFWSAVWRKRAAVIGVAFHIGLVLLMLPSQSMLLLVFGIAMMGLYLLFFDWG